MTYRQLRQEHKEHAIGPGLWSLLLEITGRIARRYPVEVYNHGIAWDDDSFEDLALEVALDRLLEERQLEYIFALADEDFSNPQDTLSRLLGFQVKRTLSHRRRVSVVDRLMTRVSSIANADPFVLMHHGNDLVVSLDASKAPAPRSLSDLQLRQAIVEIQSIPRIPSRLMAERESQVYNRTNLTELISRLCEHFDEILLSDVRKIFEQLLTAWVPTFLHQDNEAPSSLSGPEFDFERNQMKKRVQAFVNTLDDSTKFILIGKSQGVSDEKLANQLDRSRPWIAAQKSKVLGRIQTDVIKHIPEALHDESVFLMLEFCSNGEHEA